MKMKYEAIPVFEEVEVVGKTIDTIAGTIDKKPVGRTLITTAAGFEGKHQVVNGDGVGIVTVEEIGANDRDGNAVGTQEVELFVELVGGIKSLASYKFFKGYEAADRENPECNDLFTEDGEQIGRISDTAGRMCADHPECDGRWKIVDAAGKRWILRKIDTDLKAYGMRRNTAD